MIIGEWPARIKAVARASCPWVLYSGPSAEGEFSKSEATFLFEFKDRFALAYSIGIPIDVVEYHDHGLKAHATSLDTFVSPPR